MSIGRLLATRNAKTVSFNPARAGHLDMPTRDLVNGALAACPHSLGAKILECIHNPECADPKAVSAEVVHRLLQRHAKLTATFVEAESEWHLVQAGLSKRLGEGAARRRYEQAKADKWPGFVPEKYEKLIAGVFHELLRKHLCSQCGGRGTLIKMTTVSACPDCNGTGRARLTENARAVLCDMHRHAFVTNWRHVYEWLHAHLMTEIRQAEDFIYRYVRTPAPAQAAVDADTGPS